MQEDVILEIPEQEDSENDELPEWTPPVLRKTEIPERQSCADIFFIQYVVCIVILTILFSVRLWDEQSLQNAVHEFVQGIHADSEPWVLSFIAWVKSLWN
ncbi:MAG: hypothetical protein IKI37_01030 [Oscillospiraceae bacterium]|nr:hypothetical protein [Oscillospiraceae bacterium]